MPVYPPEPISLPAAAWRPDGPLARACAAHDANTVFRILYRQYRIKQERIAVLCGIDPGEISNRISGKNRGPIRHLDRWIRIAEALGMPDHIRRALFHLPAAPEAAPATPRPAPAVTSSHDPARSGRPPAPGYPARDSSEDWPHSHVGEPPVNRRDLLYLSGTALTGAVLDVLLHEPGRMRTALDTGTVTEATLTELHHEATALSTRLYILPPAEAAHEAMTRFHDLRVLLGARQTMRDQRELARLGAMFGTIVGEILFDQGHFPLARHWYATARRAATEAGDAYLADIALGGTTYLPAYTGDPHGVLDLVTARLDENPAPTPAVAWLWAYAAKAYAALGDRPRFQQAIDHAHTALDRSSPELIRPGILSFRPQKLSFYEARGWVDLHDADRATQAAAAALALYQPPTPADRPRVDGSDKIDAILVRLDQATALLHAHEPEQACRLATAAVRDPVADHNTGIVTRAREFDRQLGTQTGRADAVRDWRDYLTTLRLPQPAITSGIAAG